MSVGPLVALPGHLRYTPLARAGGTRSPASVGLQSRVGTGKGLALAVLAADVPRWIWLTFLM